MSGHIRHLFPGGNTPRGFFSYYPYILAQSEANHILCIKGGPGVGKSTFMKRVGKDMVDKGYDVEYMHCSSDPDSLDGLVIPEIAVALLDGTAPHVVDPKHPGAVDEVVNLGDFWDEKGIKQHREEIISTTREIGALFKRAYRYLGAAGYISADMAYLQGQSVNPSGASYEAGKLIEAEFQSIKPKLKQGRVRKLFATAITPDGLVGYLDTVFAGCERIHVLRGAVGTGTEQVIKKVCEAAIERGLDVEAFYCPMDPSGRMEHLVIPQLKVGFATANDYHVVSPLNTLAVNMMEHVDSVRFQYDKVDLLYSKASFDHLLAYAISNIRRAKTLHDHLETFYVPYMDFDAEEAYRLDVMKRIMAWAEQAGK